MSSAPEVLTGTRAPRAVRLEQAKERAAKAPQPSAPESAPEYNTYVSYPGGRRYRVQITAPQTFIGGDGRKQSGGKMIVVEFDEHVYRNNHKDPAIRALIDEELQKNRYFGKFGDGTAHYWLATDQKAVMEKARIRAALDTLKALPKEAVDQFLGELKQGDAADHDLSGAATK